MRFSSDNPGPCILNEAPNPLSLEEDMEDDDEVEEEDDPEEAEALREWRFNLLPPPPPGRNADADMPRLLILFPLEPSS